MDRVVKVLVVDDSAYVRKVVKQMLLRSPFIEVVGAATDGEEALNKVEELQPDVITLDLIMPNMDGVQFLKAQMSKFPIPVVIVSIADEAGEMALAALNEGAVDFVQKPTALANEKIFDLTEELIEKVKAAAKVHPKGMPAKKFLPEVQQPIVKTMTSKSLDLIAIGISTGGPQALTYLIPQLPRNLPVPVAIVLHMPVGYTKLYAERLNNISALTVVEAVEGEDLKPGMVMIAPAGRHLTFIRRPVTNTVMTHLDTRPFDTLHRPSVDVMFESAAEVYRDRVLGIVMTGMGNDGKQGAAWIKSQGGMIFTEAESSCVVYGMPRSVVEAGLSDRVVTLENMANAILALF
ncbi:MULTISPECIES: protein-glutamate methylesterase/protein-glutamine glutaminase [Planktothricoides]|uniref:Protein-glutamate methylesterase/protein-glutamine glutaminase n=2 Tax=Planktothricoides raciborskii TaxID=132608 RepID=A0AAU8JF07_9CYAN|nr:MULTISPECIES: chemotaxis response regulator protein-glutamate methylesterase [Planktothricoides]KOR34187.1 glutamate methylesterase [Planktothricoides sp. SR001]MBD2547376.1 chemotaxis response regulator protein-glutamate methylesterase [Planktothricoides raciborskii FACHB-1370]MBD2585903.1 chemotaxis response regulator protein-glutamate methylesterase [Planktothricoides raciborskii FACHB-1261]